MAAAIGTYSASLRGVPNREQMLDTNWRHNSP